MKIESLETCFAEISHKMWENFEKDVKEQAKLSAQDHRAKEKRYRERTREEALLRFALEQSTKV